MLLANTDSFRKASAEYRDHLIVFQNFIKAIKGLAAEVPALTFREQKANEIHFTIFGEEFCIRHCFSAEERECRSKLSSFRKIFPEEKFQFKMEILLDGVGNLIEQNAVAKNLKDDSDFVFWGLVLGNWNQVKI